MRYDYGHYVAIVCHCMDLHCTVKEVTQKQNRSYIQQCLQASRKLDRTCKGKDASFPGNEMTIAGNYVKLGLTGVWGSHFMCGPAGHIITQFKRGFYLNIFNLRNCQTYAFCGKMQTVKLNFNTSHRGVICTEQGLSQHLKKNVFG